MSYAGKTLKQREGFGAFDDEDGDSVRRKNLNGRFVADTAPQEAAGAILHDEERAGS